MLNKAIVSAIWVAVFATSLHLVSSSSWLSALSAVVISATAACLLTKAGSILFPPRRILLEDHEHRSKMAVFITGCDSGFGNLCARRLDQLGFRVFAGCLSVSSPAALQLQEECSQRLQLVECDVTDEKQVTAAVEQVEQSLTDSRLVSLINNAGIGVVSFAELTPIQQYQRLMEINCLGAVRVTQALLPLLARSPSHHQVAGHVASRVVFVSSIAGSFLVPYISAYTMSKVALNAFAGILRREIRRFNVSTHVISPPGYRTAILDRENIDRMMTENWAQSSERVKERYTSELFQSCKEKYLSSLDRTLLPASRSIEVVDDMIDAAVGVSPQESYVPNAGAKLRVWIYGLLPATVLNWLLTNIAKLD